MKLRCPRCQQKLNIPDKYAGKAIRCPACQRAFTVPKPAGAGGATGARLDAAKLDLEGLASLERAASEMDEQELAAAQEQVAAERAAEVQRGDPTIRTCPNCRKRTKVEDPYAEMLCSHCWQPIPALIKGEKIGRARGGPGGATMFYGELANAIAYPVPALASLGTAAGIAIAAALVPVLVLTGLANVMEMGNVGLVPNDQLKADLSGVQWILVAIFAAEVVFYSAVALHAFLDVIRTTVIGNNAPPNLGWSPASWGKSVLGYLVLLGYYIVAGSLLLYLTYPGDLFEEIRRGDVMQIIKDAGTPFGVGMFIVSIGVPMNLLGFGLGTVVQAINPVRVFKSIGRTHVHYIFLVILLSVYGIMFAAAFLTIVFEWFIPQVGSMVAGAKEGNILQVALALVAWGVVMAFYYYGNYVIARLHGVFARSFRRNLEFGTL